jgi:hypothetical protein
VIAHGSPDCGGLGDVTDGGGGGVRVDVPDISLAVRSVAEIARPDEGAW